MKRALAKCSLPRLFEDDRRTQPPLLKSFIEKVTLGETKDEIFVREIVLPI
jgi:hypothetical protein